MTRIQASSGALGQPPLGDYLGIPFNDAGRMRADTSAESIWGTPEYQCRPHSAPHQWRGLGGARILKEQDPLTREVRAYHVQFMRSLDRPIFMDGRPHPPAWAPHTWTGFSTGVWVGNTLKVTTTHLKDGYLKRGGPQTSDLYTMTEYLTRHDDILTITTVVDDPVYLEEPYVQSTTYVYDPTGSVQMETCNASAFAENGGTDRHHVPHFLPGQNTAITEWLKNEPWVPAEAARGGAKTIYPEYRGVIPGGSKDPQLRTDTLKVPASRSSLTLAAAINGQGPRDGEVHVLPVQGNVYMLVADGVNLAASVGPDGMLLVNSGAAAMTDKVQAALAQLATTATAAPIPNRCSGANCPGLQWGWASPYINTVISSPLPPRPLRYIVNTNDAAEHVGGNAKIAASGFFPRGGGFGGAVATNNRSASVIAHENVLNRMSASVNKQPAPYPEGAWPTDTFFDSLHKLPEYVNGEAVIVYHAPAATTDADSLVFFRHSEVIHAGQPLLHHQLPGDRPAERRLDSGRHRRAQPDPRPRRRGVPRAGRHVDHPEPRPAVGHRRRGLVSQHAGDDSRPRAGPEAEGPDAGAGAGGAAHPGLRRPLRHDDGPLDDGQVRGSGVSQPPGEEAMRQSHVHSRSGGALLIDGDAACGWRPRRCGRITRTAPPTT